MQEARAVTLTAPFGSLHGRLIDRRLHSGADVALVVVWPSVFSTAAVQQQLIDRLAEDAPVLAVDPPGHGLSRVAAQSRLTMAACAKATLNLVDEVCEPGSIRQVRWVGTSWGGLVGLEAALLAPDRIDHLACLNTPFAFDRPKRLRPAWLPLGARLLGTTAMFANATARSFFLSTSLTSADTAEAMAAHRATFTQGDRRQLAAAARLVFADRDDARPLLPHINVPTLVVAGAYDVLYPPEEHHALAGQLPQGDCVTVSSAHIAAVDATQEVVTVLNTAWRKREAAAPRQDEVVTARQQAAATASS